MTFSTRNIASASRRFEIAEFGTIDYIGEQWDGFMIFSEALHTYGRLCHERQIDDQRRDELRRLFHARNLLGRLPIHPRHPSVGLHMIAAPESARPSGELDAARWDCLSTGRQLLSVDHPLSNLDAALLRNQIDTSGSKKVAVVAPERFHTAIRESLSFFQGAYQLLSATELKRSDIFDIAIYPGPQFDSFHKTPIDIRKRQVAWMYSAPAAWHTVQVMWSHSFDIGEYSIWPEAPLKLSKISGPSRFRVEFDYSTPTSSLPPPVPAENGVDGVVIDLPASYRVAFGRDFGPKPHVMETDDFEVRVKTDSIDKLAVGDVLLLRLDRTERDFVRTSARGKMGGKKYDMAVACSNRFKEAVTTSASSDFRSAEARLAAIGFSNPGYYLRACQDASYIGPAERSTYIQLCTALNIPFADSDHVQFETLRSHHRQAGIAARRLIGERLKEDRSWEDEVGDLGFCIRDLGDYGNILIASTIAISTTKIAINALGRVSHRGHYVN